MDRDALKRELTEHFQQSLDQAMDAVEQAPDGAWISASEWEIRELFQKLMAQAYERILQAKLDAAGAELLVDGAVQLDHAPRRVAIGRAGVTRCRRSSRSRRWRCCPGHAACTPSRSSAATADGQGVARGSDKDADCFEQYWNTSIAMRVDWSQPLNFLQSTDGWCCNVTWPARSVIAFGTHSFGQEGCVEVNENTVVAIHIDRL